MHFICLALPLASMQVHCSLTNALQFSGDPHTLLSENCETQLTLILEKNIFETLTHSGHNLNVSRYLLGSMKNYLQFLEFGVVVGFFVFLLVCFLRKIFHLLSSQILS